MARKTTKPSRRRKGAKGPLLSRRWFDRALGASLGLGMAWAVGSVREMRGSKDDPDRSIGIAWLPEEIETHRHAIHRAAAAHGVDPRLIAIIILVESRGRIAARSRVGARGLMQVMPKTARDIARRRGLELRSADQLFDVATNIDYGTWYLADLLRRFDRLDLDKTIELAAGAYNGGPRRMRRHLERGSKLPRETRRYMDRVISLWRERAEPNSSTLAEMWPAKA